MLVLVMYATVEGQAAKVARFATDQIEAAGHQVQLCDVRQPGFAVPGQFDAVVLCGSIHSGEYAEPLVEFIRNFRSALSDVPTALITVSLSITSQFEQERVEAMAYPYSLSEATGWSPTMRHDTAGALKFQDYDYFKRLAMRRISAHAGGPVDTSKDYELTDWQALAGFITEYLQEAATCRSGNQRARKPPSTG